MRYISRMYAMNSLAVTCFIVISIIFLAEPAVSGRHEENIKIVCARVRDVNANGLSGLGYLEWLFATKSTFPAASVRGFWKELKWRCPDIW